MNCKTLTSLGEMNFEPRGIVGNHTFAPDPFLAWSHYTENEV